MLDDFRDVDADLFDDTEALDAETQAELRDFLGLTPVQRFVLAVMFLLMICLLGSMCLLVTGRIWLPL